MPIINKSLKIKTEDKIPVKKNNNNVKSAETLSNTKYSLSWQKIVEK